MIFERSKGYAELVFHSNCLYFNGSSSATVV